MSEELKIVPFWMNYAKADEEEIKGFFGDYRWMSNFHQCPVMWNGKIFPSSEHAYQYAKVHGYNEETQDFTKLHLMSPSDVKK